MKILADENCINNENTTSMKYTYQSSIDYINNLVFTRVETYSLQRGEEFEEEIKLQSREYQRLKVRKEKRNNLTHDEDERFSFLNSLLGGTQYLINEKGEFHPSSKKLNSFQSGDLWIAKLKTVLQTEIIEIPQWMCAPVYRDAIVFYDKNDEIVSVLNICLRCQYMETQKFNHISVDSKAYLLLKEFFKDIGHSVEENN